MSDTPDKQDPAAASPDQDAIASPVLQDDPLKPVYGYPGGPEEPPFADQVEPEEEPEEEQAPPTDSRSRRLRIMAVSTVVVLLVGVAAYAGVESRSSDKESSLPSDSACAQALTRTQTPLAKAVKADDAPAGEGAIGRALWKLDTQDQTVNVAATTEKSVMVANWLTSDFRLNDRPRISVYDQKSGRERWSADITPVTGRSDMFRVTNGKLYTATSVSDSWYVAGTAIDSGALQSCIQLEASTTTMPDWSVVDDVVYQQVPQEPGRPAALVAIDTKGVKWTAPGVFDGALAKVGPTLVTSTGAPFLNARASSALVGLDAETGKELWRTPLGTPGGTSYDGVQTSALVAPASPDARVGGIIGLRSVGSRVVVAFDPNVPAALRTRPSSSNVQILEFDAKGPASTALWMNIGSVASMHTDANDNAWLYGTSPTGDWMARVDGRWARVPGTALQPSELVASRTVFRLTSSGGGPGLAAATQNPDEIVLVNTSGVIGRIVAKPQSLPTVSQSVLYARVGPNRDTAALTAWGLK